MLFQFIYWPNFEDKLICRVRGSLWQRTSSRTPRSARHLSTISSPRSFSCYGCPSVISNLTGTNLVSLLHQLDLPSTSLWNSGGSTKMMFMQSTKLDSLEFVTNKHLTALLRAWKKVLAIPLCETAREGTSRSGGRRKGCDPAHSSQGRSECRISFEEDRCQ